MRKYSELKKIKDNAIVESKKQVSNIGIVASESRRVANVSKNAHIILNDLDSQFKNATKMDSTDISFLFFATALQCARQYLLTPFKERLDDQKAAKENNEYAKRSNRSHRLYHPSIEEILSNPVPYDAIYGSKDFSLGGRENIGLSGVTHRFRTLGHDPLLGWIFGTSNILTSTMTTTNFRTYHIKTGHIISGAARDKITENADTTKMFRYTKNRLLYEGIDGKIAVGLSLLRQGKHLNSDVYSKIGLPIPLISSFSPEIAQKLAQYGVDMGNVATVGKQMTFATLINSFVAMTHGLYYDNTKYSSWSLYEVKTRKILSYSNAMASASNVIYVAISQNFSKLDLGGMIVTLYRLISDHLFIKQVKQEFLEKEFYNIVMGDDYTF